MTALRHRGHFAGRRCAAVVTAVVCTLCLCASTAAEDRDGVVLFFGGDTSHGENYQARYASEHADGKTANGRGDILEKRGYDAFFNRLAPLKRGCDLVVLNLETPLTRRSDPPFPDKSLHHWSDPAEAPASLKRLGVDVVSLANNHAYDYGREGLRDTEEALQSAGLAWYGAGRDLAAAEKPHVFTSGDISVALIGAFEHRDWYEPFEFYASADKPGVNPIDVDRLRLQIARLKKLEPPPFVIVTPHWGENYVWRSIELRRVAEAMVAAGADMIVGHGAHCLQEIERIDGGWVFYSIGNFVFNTAGRFQKLKAPPYSLPLRVRLRRAEAGGYAVSVRAYPIFSDNLISDYSPHPVSAEEMDRVRELLLRRDHKGVLAEQAEWGADEHGRYLSVGESRSGP